MYRSCGVCKGYIYRSTFNVNGACACVTACELEMKSAMEKSAFFEKRAASKMVRANNDASDILLAKIFELTLRHPKPSTPASSYYLHRLRKQASRDKPMSHRTMTQMVRRYRPPKAM